jgi:c-di-GMP-binding flagellar brake protein YcgR
MPTERRRYQRISRPFEGSWSGASGDARCRIADLSLGGCFVHSLATPAQGEEALVTVAIGPHRLTFQGLVAYVEAGMGFGVKFEEIASADLDELGRLIDALQREASTPTPPAATRKAQQG